MSSNKEKKFSVEENQDNLIVAARRKHLRSWIDQHHKGSQAAFVVATGINHGELSGLLRTKSFGEKKAATIEAAAGMPAGYLVSPRLDAELLREFSVDVTPTDYIRVRHLDAQAGMGAEQINPDHPDTIGEIALSPSYIRSLMGFVPAPERLVLMTGLGDSMLPTISPGAILLVDTGRTSFEHDGVYAIDLGNGLQIKRLLDRGTAILVHSDNQMYPPFPLPESARIVGKVLLLTRLERLA